MNYLLSEYEPAEFFKFFEDISAIPRPSGEEAAIADYIENFAKNLGLNYVRDESNNVVVYKPASEGSHSKQPIILQGHLDMVCEKNSNVAHDFKKDGIKLMIKDGYLTADSTTLGADNGVAVALMLAVLSDDNLIHPPLECVFTVQEETGLFGAQRLDGNLLKGRTMINLDSEEEGVATVSCAGGMRVRFYKDAQWTATENEGVAIKISGLSGGHSGMDIGFERGNANKLMGRVLEHIAEDRIIFRIATINGGNKDNAIPRECDCVIVPSDSLQCSIIEKIIEQEKTDLQSELKATDPNFDIAYQRAFPKRTMSEKTTASIVSMLYLTPDGAQKRNASTGFIVCSLNLGVISTADNGVAITISARSSVASLQQNTRRQLALFAGHFGFAMQVDSNYPGWEYKEDSIIREVFSRCYHQLTGEKLKIEAIHAGLECGLFAEKLPRLDAIAVGPNILNCHTPDEKLEIKSCERFYNLLVRVLADFA